MMDQMTTTHRVWRTVAKMLGGAAGASLLVGLAGSPAPAVAASFRSPLSGGVSPVTQVSRCPGPNAEVEQATAAPDYVYEAWIGCGGEGFARSTDGGRHFGPSLMLPDSSGSDDPAIAVAANGTVYVSYLRYHGGYGYPVVAASFDHGATFPQVSSLIPPFQGNWGDRDFIAAGPGRTVYVTWDYGPTAAAIKIICSPIGSCSYTAGDVNAVIQKSTDGGKTWSQITPMGPGFPENGGYDASVLVEPNGRIDALIWGHRITNPITYTLRPGHEYFTSSTDGGKTWATPVKVDPQVGSIALTTWWIDGDLAMDTAGNLYATWDTQTSAGDIGWLAYSTDHGRSWSSPRRVTTDRDHATHIVQVAGAGPGLADVAWQADNSPRGYATFLRPFSITRGWLGPTIQVSDHYGNPKIWPGDTFGISMLPGQSGTRPTPERAALSWGSAIGGHRSSQIYAAVVTPRS